MSQPIRYTLAQRLPQLKGAALSVLVALVGECLGRQWSDVHVRDLAKITGFSPRMIYVALDILSEFDLVRVESQGKGRAPLFRVFPCLEEDEDGPMHVDLGAAASRLQEDGRAPVADMPSDVVKRPLVPPRQAVSE